MKLCAIGSGTVLLYCQITSILCVVGFSSDNQNLLVPLLMFIRRCIQMLALLEFSYSFLNTYSFLK